MSFSHRKTSETRVGVARRGASQAYSQSTLYRTRRQLDYQIIDTGGKRNPRHEWALHDHA